MGNIDTGNDGPSSDIIAKLLKAIEPLSEDEIQEIVRKRVTLRNSFEAAIRDGDIERMRQAYAELNSLNQEAQKAVLQRLAQVRVNLKERLDFFGLRLEMGDIGHFEFSEKILEALDIVLDGISKIKTE